MEPRSISPQFLLSFSWSNGRLTHLFSTGLTGFWAYLCFFTRFCLLLAGYGAIVAHLALSKTSCVNQPETWMGSAGFEVIVAAATGMVFVVSFLGCYFSSSWRGWRIYYLFLMKAFFSSKSSMVMILGANLCFLFCLTMLMV